MIEAKAVIEFVQEEFRPLGIGFSEELRARTNLAMSRLDGCLTRRVPAEEFGSGLCESSGRFWLGITAAALDLVREEWRTHGAH